MAALSFVFAFFLEKKGGKLLFAAAAFCTLSPLLFIKYAAGLMGDGQFTVAAAGLSFYSFRAVSYLADVYKKKIAHETDPLKYALYILFFPEFLSGPIERYGSFKACINKNYVFDYEKEAYALRLILFGVFKKTVAAEGIALYVNAVYEDPASFGGIYVLAAVILYSFQIYFDFSGYSDIACGIAYMFGFEPPENFKSPYLCTNIKDFWRRWHISLTSFLRDYIYIPLGGSRRSFSRTLFNTFAVFFISGIWHGAGITFIIWGSLHGLFMIAYLIFSKYRKPCKKAPRSSVFVSRTLSWLLTFCAVSFAWIFFRANTLTGALQMIRGIFLAPSAGSADIEIIVTVRILISLFVVSGYSVYGKDRFKNLHPALRTLICTVLCLLIYLFASGSSGEFVYFAF